MPNQFVVGALRCFFQGRNRQINFGAFRRRKIRRIRIRQRFRGGRENGFRLGARFNHLALGKILFRILDGFFQHALNVVVIQAVAWLDFNGVLRAGANILGADLQDAVRVDQEFHFNARQARRRWAELAA